MMALEISLLNVSVGVVLFAALQYLASLWISARLKIALQKEHAQFLESLKWDLKVREQSTKIAEYMALTRDLCATSSIEDYRKANHLSWELALWLPADIYRSVSKAMADPSQDTNIMSVIIDVRKLLLDEKAGDLTQDQILHVSRPILDERIVEQQNTMSHL
jgi:hypothetical protein